MKRSTTRWRRGWRALALSLPLSIFLLSVSVAQADPVTYAIDPHHTDVHFSWNHFGFSNPSADLSNVTGTITYDPAHPDQARVSVTMPLSGLDSHVPALDKVLAGKEFFAVAQYPVATFRSTAVTVVGYHRLKVAGSLSLHGVTRPVTLNVHLNRIGRHPFPAWHGAQAIGFDARTTLSRSEFGLGAYAPAVSDRIKVHITVEAIEQSAFEKQMADQATKAKKQSK